MEPCGARTRSDGYVTDGCVAGRIADDRLDRARSIVPPPGAASPTKVCDSTDPPRSSASSNLTHPCPATGLTSGRCPGYVKDHIVPLACGGPDAVSNMQWQTVGEGRAKDKWEAKGWARRYTIGF